MLHLNSSIHDNYNPYTAVQRSPSQWFLYVPDAAPMGTTTTITLSKDAVNLNTIPPSAESMVSLESRYVVPEMIEPAYGSSSDVDTRSAGNPYSHHPNFTTPSQYFDHLAQGADNRQGEEGDVLTVMDVRALEDPFGQFSDSTAPPVQINPPNDVTLNKTAFSSESIADLQHIASSFPLKGAPEAANFEQYRLVSARDETINKKMLSPESMYELAQTADVFEPKTGKLEYSNMLVMRDFSPQSLADLRELPSISQYSDQMTSSKDVATCVGISPTPTEIRRFEWTENAAYGGF